MLILNKLFQFKSGRVSVINENTAPVLSESLFLIDENDAQNNTNQN